MNVCKSGLTAGHTRAGHRDVIGFISLFGSVASTTIGLNELTSTFYCRIAARQDILLYPNHVGIESLAYDSQLVKGFFVSTCC